MSNNKPVNDEKQDRSFPQPQDAGSGPVSDLVSSENPAMAGKKTKEQQEQQEITYRSYKYIRGAVGSTGTPNAGTCTRARTRGLVPERQIEAALTAATRAAGGLCWKFTSPGTAGVPDRIVILPGPAIGFVECKTTGSQPRPQQVRRLRQLRELGVPVFVLDHLDDIEEVLDAIRRA